MSSVYISHAGSYSLRTTSVGDYRLLRSCEKHFNVCWNDTRFKPHNLQERYVLHLSWKITFNNRTWALQLIENKASWTIFLFLGLERIFCVPHKQQTPRSEKICHFSGSRTKNQRHTKAPCFGNCLKFCFKVRTIFWSHQNWSFTA